MPPPLDLKGQTASPGIVIGPIVRLANGASMEHREAGTPEAEAAALAAAIDHAIKALEALTDSVGEGDGADVLAFQIAMLEDEALSEPAYEAIATGTPAEEAWRAAMAIQIAEYTTAEDEYFRARVVDMRDIRDRVLARLHGAEGVAEQPMGAILVGEDMTPSRFLGMDWRGGGGIALNAGSPSSHVAMLARSRGIPMLVGLDEAIPEVAGEAILDAEAGHLILAPTPEQLAIARDAIAKAEAAARVTGPIAPALAPDGTPVALLINIATVEELETLDPAICDGIGLARTELMFHGADGMPAEETQYHAYRRIVEWADGRPVTIRTLDAGGDKPIPGFTFDGESNPFLGTRGIRLSLKRPEVFRTQLRALARAAYHGNLEIMLPMVTIPAELEMAHALLDRVVMELSAENIPNRPPALGIMVEVPAAALTIECFPAAFYSIGSNDLIQYTTASARDIGAVAPLADPQNPAVIRLIGEVARHGALVGRKVSVCGDMAGQPRHVAALLRAGVRALSMAPVALPAVRAAIAASHG